VREIVPGLFHWTAFHEGIHKEVSSYFLADGAVLFDPLLPRDGFDVDGDPLEWLRRHGPPTAILLSNRHHYRSSGRLVEAFSVPVYASEPGMHEFLPGQGVRPFRFGDELPGGVVAHEVGAICPDETAFEIPSVGALAVADGITRFDALDGPLGFVPDYLLGDDPEGVKAGLREAYGRLLRLDFEHLLLAHGLPAVDDGKEQLRAFLEHDGV
jgi:hypothetical protein